MDETSRHEAIRYIANQLPTRVPSVRLERLPMLSDVDLAGLYEATRSLFESEAKLAEATTELAIARENWIAKIIALGRLKAAFLGRFMTSGARISAFEPTCEDAFSRFMEEISSLHENEEDEEIEAAHRRLGREIGRAFGSTWRAIIADRLARSARWVAVAVLGDGVVRAIYWTFSEIVRRW